MTAFPSATTGPTIWIGADQCTLRSSALADADPARAVVLMVEPIADLRARPHHVRKLVLWLAVMRHFADGLRAAGWTVDYHADAATLTDALADHVARYGPSELRAMTPADGDARDALANACAQANLSLALTTNVNFCSEPADFARFVRSDDARVTMETFYRGMRRKTGLLMDGEAPAGGAWNFDAQNRERPAPGLRFPEPMRFEPDGMTREAIALVARRFPAHPGAIGDFALPVTRAEALAALDDFVTQRLPTFGRWQDAMLAGNRTMSHSLLSAAINVGLLGPLEVCERAELAYRSGIAPIASVEGFIRQIIGWREFVWQIYCRVPADYRTRNALEATLPLPAFYRTRETAMRCLGDILDGVHETAYAHHIGRLMLLGNFALIAGIDPLETNDWFREAFIDGYDWVMVPNVIGMALHADGGYVGTKPYAASANYINGMSDYCRGCRYDPKALNGDDACPFNALYWDFLARNEDRFARNHRMRMVVQNWRGRAPEWQARVRAKAAAVRGRLARGEHL